MRSGGPGSTEAGVPEGTSGTRNDCGGGGDQREIGSGPSDASISRVPVFPSEICGRPR